MPKKHGVSYKHLISTSSQDLDRTYPNPTSNTLNAGPSRGVGGVQDLLDRSRLARPVRPRLIDDVEGAVWVARPLGRLDLELEEGPTEIHPAEQLRRAQLAQRQAQRSVAGPAPPSSWRSRRAVKPASTTQRHTIQADETDLYKSSRLFSPQSGGRRAAPRQTGTARLMEYCFQAVIRYLDSDEVLWTDPADVSGVKSVVTLGRATREGLPYLDTHLKIALMVFDSGRSSDQHRMSDQSIRALLSPINTTISTSKTEEEMEDWDHPILDSDLDRTALVHHLAFTLHPSPHTLLRSITQSPLIALTSLDLSYSCLPENPERLVNALPTGLRELSLAGARVVSEEKDWTRALGLLGRRLLVLKMLDLSFLQPDRVDIKNLEALLQPSQRQLPSLRLLGLRTHSPSLTPTTSEMEKNGAPPSATPQRDRRELVQFIRQDRRSYIEIVWD